MLTTTIIIDTNIIITTIITIIFTLSNHPLWPGSGESPEKTAPEARHVDGRRLAGAARRLASLREAGCRVRGEPLV